MQLDMLKLGKRHDYTDSTVATMHAVLPHFGSQLNLHGLSLHRCFRASSLLVPDGHLLKPPWPPSPQVFQRVFSPGPWWLSAEALPPSPQEFQSIFSPGPWWHSAKAWPLSALVFQILFAVAVPSFSAGDDLVLLQF